MRPSSGNPFSSLYLIQSRMSKLAVSFFPKTFIALSQELNMGVKDCDVLIDGHKVWSGVIDKVGSNFFNCWFSRRK